MASLYKIKINSNTNTRHLAWCEFETRSKKKEEKMAEWKKVIFRMQ